MKIEVLFVPGCPYAAPTTARLRDLLASMQVSAKIVEVQVADAAAAASLGFPGSPTVRINGRDIGADESGDLAPSMACRLYSRGAEAGIPPLPMIRRAILAARRGKRQ